MTTIAYYVITHAVETPAHRFIPYQQNTYLFSHSGGVDEGLVEGGEMEKGKRGREKRKVITGQLYYH